MVSTGTLDSPAPSPVTSFALDKGGFSSFAIFTPEKPGDPDFIARLEALEPDLFVTAAYGNYLPSRVLQLPRHGTLNIHPSLLPLYRGAAPVQRALLDGATTTGVSVLYSVKRMDAGPILAQAPFEVASDIQAPELTCTLFSLGTRLLISSMPAVLAGHGPSQAVAQDESRATEAPKLGPADAPLDFLRRSAAEIHAQVRACAGWPGSTAVLAVQDAAGGPGRELTIKVLQTRDT
ncbi:hypothetical protein QBZ16_003882 [Prototheca wickerhamii]|uniref:methionyl-tRNA formyltransferase n=1 Tax=Prototheca wickerhamii TaxID=3111 RepID=A0AAD9MH56_PROWI|nr:hypothetical protein QBZ16_003882 [Prototheca wickerhamii]